MIKFCRRRCVTGCDEAKLYFNFKTICALNLSYTLAFYPIAITGHKVIVIPLTVASSYGVLYMLKLIHHAPMLYGFYIVVTAACMLFQVVWYQLCSKVLSPAIIINKHFVNMNWMRKRSISSRRLFRSFKFPAGEAFGVFQQWKPHVFLKKIFVSTMKVHFYLRK